MGVAGMRRVWSTGDAAGGFVGGAVRGSMGIASTVSTYLLTFTYRPNVSKALALVAADGFMEVLAHCYDMAFDIDSLT